MGKPYKRRVPRARIEPRIEAAFLNATVMVGVGDFLLAATAEELHAMTALAFVALAVEETTRQMRAAVECGDRDLAVSLSQGELRSRLLDLRHASAVALAAVERIARDAIESNEVDSDRA